MSKKIVIDGRQLLGKMGGVQRYISEMLAELDKIAGKDEFEVLIPAGEKIPYEYRNLKVVEYGKLKGLLWEQICIPMYLMKHRYKALFPCSIVSMLYPRGIAVIHDVMIAADKDLAKSIANPVMRWLLLLNFRIAVKHADVVVTDATVSKQDMINLYHVNPDKIHIIGCGWEHAVRSAPSDDIWKKHPELEKGNFYFSLSANRKQKNFKWIAEAAKRHPDDLFVIAGTQEEWQKQSEYSADNLIHLGYVTDGEIRTLMENCKAFLFPSYKEGFGMPPMEALALGAEIVVANASCLPEIYADSAYYIDPFDYNMDLNKILNQDVGPAQNVLERYSWKITAEKMLELCRTL